MSAIAAAHEIRDRALALLAGGSGVDQLTALAEFL